MTGDGESADRPVAALTPELLADLQAGVLDDATAAEVRRRARDDPAAQHTLRAFDRVRVDLAGLATDPSAPQVPGAVTARISAALQAAAPLDRPDYHRVIGRPGDAPATHSVRAAARSSRLRRFGAIAGLAATALAVGLGTTMLSTQSPTGETDSQPTAKKITVAPPANVPLTGPQIQGLLGEAPDYGPLGDPQRRASCLSGLGYSSSTKVLGARPIDMSGRPGVLIVLPGVKPGELVALVVSPNCSSVDTGLLASKVVG